MKTDKVKLRELRVRVEKQKREIELLTGRLKAMTLAWELCRERFNGFAEAVQSLAPALAKQEAEKGGQP